MASALRLQALADVLAIVRLDAGAPVPAWAFDGPGLAAAIRRDGELTVVCREIRVPSGLRAERGWCGLEVAGPLDLALTGVLARLTVPLAQAGIPIFALATFDTDVLLVRVGDLERAAAALRDAGHAVDVSRFS